MYPLLQIWILLTRLLIHKNNSTCRSKWGKSRGRYYSFKFEDGYRLDSDSSNSFLYRNQQLGPGAPLPLNASRSTPATCQEAPRGKSYAGLAQLARGEKRPGNMSHRHSVTFWQLQLPHSMFKRTAKARKEAVCVPKKNSTKTSRE